MRVYVLLIAELCLLACIKVQSIEENGFLIAPDKSSDETFAVLQYEQIIYQSPRKLCMQLRVYNQQTEDYKQCSLNLTARWGAVKAGVSTIRRLTGDRIIIAWYDEMLEASDRRTRVIGMNDNCQQINPIIDNLPEEPKILPSVAYQFDLIVDDEIICRSVGRRCRITYNLAQNNAGRVWPLDVQLDWASIKIERLRNGDFLARGYDGTTYRILRLNHLTGVSESLLQQFEANPEPEFVTSDLSICGIVYPGYDKFAQCVQYRQDNQLAFQKRPSFDEPMSLIAVRTLAHGRMFLLVGKARCSGEFDCWQLFGLDLRDGRQPKRHSFSHFLCTGDRKSLRIFDLTLTNADRIAVSYACKNDHQFNYNINYFDVDDDGF